jgi:hypothetical protein
MTILVIDEARNCPVLLKLLIGKARCQPWASKVRERLTESADADLAVILRVTPSAIAEDDQS